MPADNLDTDVEDVLGRYRHLLSQVQMFWIEYQEIADYIIPRKNSILVQRVPGTKRTQKLYDSTALKALQRLAASIHGTLTSSYIRWFFLEVDDEDLAEKQEVREWLEDCSARMLTAFNKSNFSQECHELYLDLGSFATANLFFEEAPRDEQGKWGGFRFREIAAGKFVCAEGPDGRINTVFRNFPMSAQSALMEPQFKDMSKDAHEMLTDSKPDKTYEIIHGCFPGTGSKSNLFRSLYLLYKGHTKLSEGEFKEFPFMVPRWSKNPDESYGRGPSHDALPDVRSLNKIVELELRRMALDVHPPMKQLSGDSVGPIRMVPGGLTTVRSMEGLAPLLTGAEQTFQVVNLKKEELVHSIQEIYFYDQLQLPQGPQMTAEEVVTRMELMERLLGPTVGRLEAEFLRPVIDRAWAIMWRANMASPAENILPEIPAVLQEAMAQRKVPLKIRFEGPLARAQKSADATAITALLGFVTPLVEGQIAPEAADVVNWDNAVKRFGEVKGVPAELFRSNDDVTNLRTQKARQMQQAQQTEQMTNAAPGVASMMKAGSSAPEPGSPMASMMKPQNGAPVQ